MPTFTRTFVAGNGTSNSRTELALHRDAGSGVVTVYAASGTDGGTLQRSIDGGATWAQRIDNNFCTAQCFYDIAVAVDPTDVDRIYLGGSPNLPFGISINGGTSFTTSAQRACTSTPTRLRSRLRCRRPFISVPTAVSINQPTAARIGRR